MGFTLWIKIEIGMYEGPAPPTDCTAMSHVGHGFCTRGLCVCRSLQVNLKSFININIILLVKPRCLCLFSTCVFDFISSTLLPLSSCPAHIPRSRSNSAVNSGRGGIFGLQRFRFTGRVVVRMMENHLTLHKSPHTRGIKEGWGGAVGRV